jgi:probable phosphoglycerate mutase
MAVTRLYLVRHGQSAGNAEGRFGGHSPTPLSELGRKQAAVTADLLARERIDAIYSSDLLRAVETAKPLANLLGMPIIETPIFRERHVGVLEGLTFDESKEMYPDDYYALIHRRINHTITEGESYRDLLDRVSKGLQEIFRKHMGRKVVIYSHTGAICYMTLHLMGAIHRHTKQTPWLVTSNCGINRFEVRGPRNIRVLAVNDTKHLDVMTGNDSFGAKS